MRCNERIDNIRELDISETIRKNMGIITSSSDESMIYSIVVLSTKLLKTTSDIQKTCTGKNVLSGFFYSSLSMDVAPSHLLTCLIKTLLRTVFSKVVTAESQKRLQHHIFVLSLIMDLLRMAHFSMMRRLPQCQLFLRFSFFLHISLESSQRTM